jgi:DNA-binding response OmpR family regulator
MNLYDSKILIVDDEQSLLELVVELLSKEGYHNIDTAKNCHEAITISSKKEYHIILLDVMLPDGDGFSLFKHLNNTPVIFLSARDEDSARLKGLGLGADDYITKPFLPEELMLRLKAVLKRTYKIKETTQTIQIGNITVNWDAGTLTSDTATCQLTAKEYTLLKKLCDNRGKILSIDTLCNTLWTDGNFGYENSLMVHIRHLRSKIEPNPSSPQYLVTVRGLGYKLNP